MSEELLAHINVDHDTKQPLLNHLTDTAELAREFGAVIDSADEAYCAGILHDIGKASKEFQARLFGGPKVDHSTAGSQIAFKFRYLTEAFAIAGHHGGLPNLGTQIDSPDSSTLWGRIKRTNIPDYSNGLKLIDIPKIKIKSFKADERYEFSFFVRMIFSCLVDADYLDTEKFMLGTPRKYTYDSFDNLLNRINRFIEPWWKPNSEINKIRCNFLKQCIDHGKRLSKGLYSLTMPTGGGKTIASLAFALNHVVMQNMSRIIYVIPYTSIIDQTASIYKSILGEVNVVEHHSGNFSLRETDNIDEKNFRWTLATENWDAPVIVTTAVQFFESLYSNRPSKNRKLHNVADSVIVLDEAQTIPIGYMYPCLRAIKELVNHYKCTALLCTATQPGYEFLDQKLLNGFLPIEIINCIEKTPEILKRVNFELVEFADSADLIHHFRGYKQLLCVVNRRNDAVEIYHKCCQGDGYYCLSTLLRPIERKKYLEEIKYRLEHELECIVISTSLIEAGVDFDFPVVFREKTGLDSVLQVAGRCNREGKRSKDNCTVYIFTLKNELPVKMLKQNIDAFDMTVSQSGKELDYPVAINEYYKNLYALKGGESLDYRSILAACNNLEFSTVDEKFHLIDSDTTNVLILTNNEIEILEEIDKGNVTKSLLREIQQYCVSVFDEQLRLLLSAHALRMLDNGAYLLDDLRLYDLKTGLNLAVEGGDAFIF